MASSPRSFLQEDILVEVSFLNKTVGPNLLEHLILVDKAPIVLDQHLRACQKLRRQRHKLAIARASTCFLGIHSEWTKFVHVVSGRTSILNR